MAPQAPEWLQEQRVPQELRAHEGLCENSGTAPESNSGRRLKLTDTSALQRPAAPQRQEKESAAEAPGALSPRSSGGAGTVLCHCQSVKCRQRSIKFRRTDQLTTTHSLGTNDYVQRLRPGVAAKRACLVSACARERPGCKAEQVFFLRSPSEPLA